MCPYCPATVFMVLPWTLIHAVYYMYNVCNDTYICTGMWEHTNLTLKQSPNSTLLPRNDWFLNGDVIDPYPGCKWKPPQHQSWQPALVLLGRWVAMCGKMRAICLDGAMSSACRVGCKQVYLSRYDKPWTVITRITHTETPSFNEAKLSYLWLICAQSNNSQDAVLFSFKHWWQMAKVL